MNEFIAAVVKVARFLSLALVILLAAVAAGLIFAPDRLWQLVRWALVFLCLGGAAAIVIPTVKSWFRRK